MSDLSEEEQLLQLIEKEDVDGVMAMLKNVDINHGFPNNMTPLHAVAFSEKESQNLIKICFLLVKCGAIVNAKIKDTKETPLHFAAYRGNVEISKVLIRFLADVNAVNEFDETPLYFACNFDNVETIKLLLKNKANIFFANKKGVTAFEKLQKAESAMIVMKHIHKLYQKKVKKIFKLEGQVSNLVEKLKKSNSKRIALKEKLRMYEKGSSKDRKRLSEKYSSSPTTKKVEDEVVEEIIPNKSESVNKNDGVGNAGVEGPKKKKYGEKTIENANKLKMLFEQRYGNKNLVKLAKKYRRTRSLRPNSSSVYKTFQKIRKKIAKVENEPKNDNDDDDEDDEEEDDPTLGKSI